MARSKVCQLGHGLLKLAVVAIWRLSGAVLGARVTTDRQVEQVGILRQDGFLELEDQLRADDGGGLRATAVDILLGVLYLVGLPEGPDLVDTVSLPEHDL